MSYADQNTPVIEKITLPSGSVYYIADRELRDVVDSIRDTIAGGVSFIIAWDGTDTPITTQIPDGITITYSGTTYTGSLDADNATPGAFYLIKSSTLPSEDPNDIYEEYVPVGVTGSKTWEKIGDTKLNLTDTVTIVTFNKSTDTVLGTSSTFNVTNPTIALATDTSSGTGKVQIVSGISSASASGDSVTAVTSLGTPSTETVLTGVQVTTQPTITLTANNSTATGRITYVEGLGTPATQSAVKSVSPTTKKLATSTVTGVQSTTTTASKATSASISYANGSGTASSTNTDWLKGVSVSNGSLILGAATMNTSTETFSDVTVPIKDSSATTIATGSTTTSGSGADIVTDVSVGESFSAVTGYTPTTKYLSSSASGTVVGANGTASVVTGYTPTTDTVLGTGSTITVTPSTTYIKATATGGAVSATGDNVTVLKSDTDITVTKGN